MQSSFKANLSLSKRKELAEKIFNLHSNCVPVIVDRAADSPNLPELEKQKYLTPKLYTMAKFCNEITGHLSISEQSHICFHVGNGVRAMPSQLMSQVYSQFRDEDGFLYVSYGEHKSFGSC